jgi:putative acetyltransferase
MIEIREAQPSDAAAIREVNQQAFGGEQEANIVDALRANGAVLLSLVATGHDRVVAHILYSPATIGDVQGAALGPLAVLPEYQRQGIGGSLVEAGNARLISAACPFTIVLGHAAYYPRFGFTRASDHGIRCEWDVSAEVFMVRFLNSNDIGKIVGLAKYRHEFSTVG